VLSLAQLKSAEGVHWAGTRKRLVLWTAGLQGILWIPTAFVAPLFGPGGVGALIVLYTLGMTSNAFGTPAWGSIVSEYLRADDRGRFFGKRTLALGVGTAIAGLLAGAVLQATKGNPILGFSLLCIAAALSRGVSWIMLTKLYDPPWEEPHESRLSFFEFLSRARSDNFVRFTLLMAAMSFWTFVSSPYVPVYMLEDLRYEYMTYSIVVLAGNLLGNLMIPRWGRIGDRHGNWLAMKWTFVGVGLIPFLWAISGNPVWLMFLFFLGGFLWGGLNLCSVNFVYDAASPAQRTRYLAYFNVVNGMGISAGTFTTLK
jgi:MFS family permease